MSRQRGTSFSDSRNPHNISLKVLRLTRPSLSHTIALPFGTDEKLPCISQRASLPYPQADPVKQFLLTPVLALPESFQSAYVGEIFNCTICANNELSASDTTKRINGVRVQAEVQSPASPAGVALNFESQGKDTNIGSIRDIRQEETLEAGTSLQRVVAINLREPGNHVLAITVSYTETQLNASGHGAAGGRTRTFRKLYQFVAQNLVGVRTKAGPAARRDGRNRYVVEAQLENLGERVVSLEAITMNSRPPFASTSLNWDKFGTGPDMTYAPMLNPRDVYQVAYLLEETREEHHGGGDSTAEDGKVVLGQLNLQWRSAMGDRGSLSTGWLVGRSP